MNPLSRCLFTAIAACLFSFHASAQLCAIPQNLITSGVTENSAVLNWDSVDGAIVYRIVGNAVGATGGSVSLLVPKTTFDVTGLNSGVSYYWSVRAICDSAGANVSELAVNDTFTTLISSCAIPQELNTDTVGSDFAILSWEPVSGAVAYRLTGNAVGTATGQLNVLLSDTSYQMTMLNPAVSYWWTVRAICDSMGQSVSSYATNDTFTTEVPECPTPESPLVVSVGETTVTLGWDAVTGAIGYEIEGATIDGGTTVNIIVPGGASNSYIAASLVPNTSYIWKVRAYCAIDQPPSLYSDPDTFATIYNCYPVFDLTVDSISDTSVTVSWDTFEASDAALYTIYGNRLGTGTVVSVMVSPPATSLSVDGLQPNTSYQWAVIASCGTPVNAFSPLSEIDTFTTDGPSFKMLQKKNGLIEHEGLTVSPNPMSASATIDLSKTEGAYHTATIYTISGTVVRSYTIQDQMLVIERGELSGGLYLVQLLGETSSRALKFVIRDE